MPPRDCGIPHLRLYPWSFQNKSKGPNCEKSPRRSPSTLLGRNNHPSSACLDKPTRACGKGLKTRCQAAKSLPLVAEGFWHDICNRNSHVLHRALPPGPKTGWGRESEAESGEERRAERSRSETPPPSTDGSAPLMRSGRI